MRTTALALFVAMISSHAAAEAIEYVCTFTVQASVEGLQPAGNFKFSLTLDSLTGDAFMTGNNGVSQVFSHRQGDTVSFLEPLASGAINTTTVIGSGDAVHSRHVVFGADDLFPSQYYGTCER